MLPRIAAALDGQTGRALAARFSRARGSIFGPETRVNGAKADAKTACASHWRKATERRLFSCDRLLVAAGRGPIPASWTGSGRRSNRPRDGPRPGR